MYKDLGDVEDVDLAACRVVAHHPAEVHRARKVGRRDGVGAAFENVFDFQFPHRQRRSRHLDAERAAESAAFVDRRDRGVFEVFDVEQERLGGVGHPQLAPAVAADVKTDLARIARAQVGDL